MDLLTAIGPKIGLGYLQLVHLTARYSIAGVEHWKTMRYLHGRGVLICWHNRIMGAMMFHRHRNIGAVISKSGDGELLSRAMVASGYTALRGSSSRGGTGALKGALRHLKEGHDIVITPDGPKGPRYVAQPGAVFASQRSGMPILPIGVGIGWKKCFASWDRFQLPYPFSHIQIVYGEPFVIPQEMGVEEGQALIANRLTEATLKADSLLGVVSP